MTVGPELKECAKKVNIHVPDPYAEISKSNKVDAALGLIQNGLTIVKAGQTVGMTKSAFGW